MGLYVLNPTYSLRVVITDELPDQTMRGQTGMVWHEVPEGQYLRQPAPSGHKWHDPLAGKTGCDEVLSAVKDALAKAGLQAEVHFVSFEHR
jgi:hypothetical protein